MTNAEIRREARWRGGREYTAVFFLACVLAYALAYAFEVWAPLMLGVDRAYGVIAGYPAVYAVYALGARVSVAAWRRSKGIEHPANGGGRAFAGALLAAAVFAAFRAGFWPAARIIARGSEYGWEWLFWAILAVRIFFSMWLNMLFFAMAAMDGEVPLRALGRGLAGLFRHFFRIAAMQFALWWQTWLLAAAVAALVFCDWPAAEWLDGGLFLLAVILFVWRSARVRLAYAGLATVLFEVNE